MCYNIIQYHEFQCTHCSLIKRQPVDCNYKYCRFSSRHETNLHDCASTCKQT
ncbi:hypothetical protein OG21DRAFT_1415561 [Imleria badia]|nr:hypothetical protein OG21DRAFT_1415561 [Imleria badia]